MDIFREYQENVTRADSTLTGKFLGVVFSSISRIEADGKVVLVVDELEFQEMQMYFEDPREVLPLNPGDSVTAFCTVRGIVDQFGMGMGFGLTVVFEECRLFSNQ